MNASHLKSSYDPGDYRSPSALLSATSGHEGAKILRYHHGTFICQQLLHYPLPVIIISVSVTMAVDHSHRARHGTPQ